MLFARFRALMTGRQVQKKMTKHRADGVCGAVVLLILCSFDAHSQQRTFTNPILNGGYPDPSICRDGEDFYIVNSSFEYFPGLPLHHSKDLVNWELVGYGLHRAEQASGAVNLVDVQSNGGIHAPTLRCHEGRFYIITTNVYTPAKSGEPTQMVNFVITADTIQGPWSQPNVIDNAPGIDPDLFFDDDGRVWYVGTHSPEEPAYGGEGEIYLQELNPKTWQFMGDRHFLWRGAVKFATWAEGPHLYKKDGRYYLLVAEGGTSFNHAVTVAVSDQITGPYEGNHRNPILTSRHLSYDNWVHSTGHADMVELADGRWYMVALSKRGDIEGETDDGRRGANMGRETHLLPVVWERVPFNWVPEEKRILWPVVAPLTGKVERDNPLPFSDKPQYRALAWADNFDQSKLKLDWNFRRVPENTVYSLTARPGYLRLYTRPEQPMDRARASLMGVRQPESDFTYRVSMAFMPAANDASTDMEAGINLFQKDNNYIAYTLLRRGQAFELQLQLAERDESLSVLKNKRLSDYKGTIQLEVVSKNDRYVYRYSLDGGDSWLDFAESDANLLVSRGYTGAYFGLYSSSRGRQVNAHADFDWVRYQAHERRKEGL